MGCSAGMIAIGLAQRLLKAEPGKYALVVSTENITQNWCALPSCSVQVEVESRLPVSGRQPGHEKPLRAAHLVQAFAAQHRVQPGASLPQPAGAG